MRIGFWLGAAVTVAVLAGELTAQQRGATQSPPSTPKAAPTAPAKPRAATSTPAGDMRYVQGLFEFGGALDIACENCHLEYWYPDDKKNRK